MQEPPAAPEPPARPVDSFVSAPPERPRSPRTRILTALVTVTVLVAAALAFLFTRGGSNGGPDVALALDFKRDNTISYRMHMGIDATLGISGHDQPLNETMDSTAGYRTLAVDDRGVATIEFSMEDLTLSVNGQSVPNTIGDVHSKLRITPDGRILSGGAGALGGGSGGLGSIPGFDQLTPLLPDGPVGPGDTWDKTYSRPFPLGGGTIDYSTHNTFDRYETVSGERTAVIESEVRVPLDLTLDLSKLMSMFQGLVGQSGTTGVDALRGVTLRYGGSMKGTQTCWFDPEAGNIVKGLALADFDLTMTFEGLPSGGALSGTEMHMVGSVQLAMDPVS
ncbi:MAG: hypothetical protein ABR600_03955 [Actinomycetota bacterium]